MNQSLVEMRKQRNSSILNLKNQDVKKRYASGKVRIDVRGTEDEMTSNTILAVPSSLLVKEGVSLAKDITIAKYTKAGPDAELVDKTVVGIQSNMVDFDEALESVAKTGVKMGARQANSNMDKQTSGMPQMPSTATTDAAPEFGRVIKRATSANTVVNKDLVAIAKTLLGR